MKSFLSTHSGGNRLDSDKTVSFFDSPSAVTNGILAPISSALLNRRPLIAASILALTLTAGPALADSFSYTGGAQSFTVLVTGVYDIVAYGAQGGNADGTTGGLGAEIGGEFLLTAGQILTIDVGGSGSNGGPGTVAGGGGGGSFVVLGANTPLVVAGGGGGGAFQSPNGGGGLTGTSGANGSPSGGMGGTNGMGGSGGYFGSGGAGFLTNGGNSSGGGSGGGQDYANGLAGGSGAFGAGNGGFGGGGGADAFGGGGGGGYSGGGGGGTEDDFEGAGGGGGSFLATSAFNTSSAAGIQAGNGLVIITAPVPAVPEPANVALLGLGLLALPALRKLRKRS